MTEFDGMLPMLPTTINSYRFLACDWANRIVVGYSEHGMKLTKSREDIRFEVSFDKLGPQLGDPPFIQHLPLVSTLRQLG